MQKNKHFSIVQLVGLGMLSLFIVLGISVVPSMKAMAKTEWDGNTGTLTLSGTVEKVPTIDNLCPINVSEDQILHVVIESGTKFPADSSKLFYNFSSVTSIDLTNADISGVTTMANMFDGCSGLTSITFGSGWNTAGVTNMHYMFNDCSSLTQIDLSSFNTSNVTDMAGMFSNCSSVKTLNLTTFNTSQITGDGMDLIFSGCSALEKIIVGDGWAVGENTAAYNMFDLCFNLVGGNGTRYVDNIGTHKAYAHIDGGASNPGYLSNLTQAELLARLKTDGNNFNLELCIQKEKNYDYEVLVTPTISIDTTEDQTYFGFVLTCNAKNIVDEYTVVINKIGPDQSKTEICNRSVSVAGYLKRLIDSSSTDITTKDRRIAGCILRYGAAAQKYFGYKTTNLANKDVDGYGFDSLSNVEIPEPGRYEKSDIDGNEDLINNNITYYGMTTSFASNLNLILVFRSDINNTAIQVLSNYLGAKHGAYSHDLSVKADESQKFYLAYITYSIKSLDEPALQFGGENGTSISVVQYLGLTQNTSPDYNTLAKALYAFHLEAKNYN